jgi:hypothetical protein
MSLRSFICTVAAFACAAAPVAHAQAPDSAAKKIRATKFFDSQDPVDVTLVINLKRIRGDKDDKAPWRAATLSYMADGKTIEIPIKARTRGIWRLKNCDFPPLRLDLPNKPAQGTVFEGLNKPKLVSYCKNTDTFEQYVLQEFQLYRAYNVLTPISHRARLLRMTYTDSATAKPLTTRYAIMLEEPDLMASRFDGIILDQQGARSRDLNLDAALLAGLFQYFIANTDHSVAYLHNYELIARDDGEIFPVAFDFDFAGAVNAQYATVDPSLSVRRVRDRLFRGYCAKPEEYGKAFDVFKQRRDAIYSLYNDDLGKLLDRKVASETLKFYDEFYETISDSRLTKRRIFDACINQ